MLAPERDDDDGLKRSAWIARQTIDRAPHPPVVLAGTHATRAAFEQHVTATPGLMGVAFFGHGGTDRLFDANRLPPKQGPAAIDSEKDGPAAIDSDNVALLRGRWIHAFACWSGSNLAGHAVQLGAAIYVGYQQPLDVGWTIPPPAEREFVEMVTCVTLALLAGERDERVLRAAVSRTADAFFEALAPLPDTSPGLMWLYKLGQDLVDQLVVIRR